MVNNGNMLPNNRSYQQQYYQYPPPLNNQNFYGTQPPYISPISYQNHLPQLQTPNLNINATYPQTYANQGYQPPNRNSPPIYYQQGNF